jgi:hypothetical protein
MKQIIGIINWNNVYIITKLVMTLWLELKVNVQTVFEGTVCEVKFQDKAALKSSLPCSLHV